MKNIWMVLFFFISLNAFCQGVNNQPVEIKYIPVRSLNANNSINILDIDDYISILNDKKINIVLITDSLFAFENNSVIYTLSRNGYKTLSDFSDSKKKKFNDSSSYYTALDLKLTSQEELDRYQQEERDRYLEELQRVSSLLSSNAGISWDDYLPSDKVSDLPRFNEREINADLIYPPLALRSGIEGRVILELFVDREGYIRQVLILQESPQDRGFGEAAVKAFIGKRLEPARVNGETVATRYRYPVTFRIK
jgi:protein TonB